MKKVLLFLKTIVGSLFCFCVLAVFCFAAEDGAVFDLGDPQTPWHIEADALQTLGDNIFSATGRVIITRAERRIQADEIRFDANRQDITAIGHVTVTAGPDVLSGQRLEMNLETETGSLSGGELFLGENHFYIAGDRIEKAGSETYKIDNFRITTCDPADPDWHLTGRDLSVTVEGYGTMRHAAFWVKKVPVLYVPYLFFPVKTRRQTGLLVPELDYSREKGLAYGQPFFWAIDDSSDMTFYAQAMARRGVLLGAEYRQVFDQESRLAVMINGLNDSLRNESGPGAVDDYDYGNDDDAWLRTNGGRYWFRMKQDQALGWGIKTQVDIDVVSDQDYLKDFDDGYMGFDKTDAFFEKFFGRDLDEADETVRTNNISLHKRGAAYSLNAALRWEDDVIKRRWQDTDTTVQRLPVVMFDAVRQTIPGLPLVYDLDSEYTFCFRQDGAKGHRTDIHPRLYLPLYAGRFLALEPSAGVRHTAWWMDQDDPLAPSRDRDLSRTVYDMKLDLASEIARVFSWDGRRPGAALKHAILPRIVYAYAVSPDADERFPVFDDALDLIPEENRVTYAIENVFTLRTATAGPSSSQDPAFRYREVCRLNLSQSYDIKEAREDDPAGWANGVSRRPFSPIRVELELRPRDNFRLDMDAGWDKYKHGWSEYDIRVDWFDRRGDGLYVSYKYDRDVAESIYVEAALALNRTLTLYGDHEHNFFDHQDIETGVGLLYTADCWSLDLRFTDEPDDDKISFMVRLHGLSDSTGGLIGRRFAERGTD